MQKVTPHLWYQHDNAIEVAKFYKEIFGAQNVTITNEDGYDDTPSGSIQVVTITIFDLPFILLSAGPHHDFNDAVSFNINCKNQGEIDTIWDAITKNGGKESMCGWCQDKFGVRWQVAPENMSELIATKDAQQAMLKMKKLIIADLEAANQ